MLLARGVFNAKYGHGDELVSLFRELAETHPTMPQGHLLVDASGPFFTVVHEQEFNDWSEWHAFMSGMGDDDQDFGAWFGRMMEVTDGGQREFYTVVTPDVPIHEHTPHPPDGTPHGHLVPEVRKRSKLVVRDVFEAKYGHGDALVALFKELPQLLPNGRPTRISVDASGPFFTVVTEMIVDDWADWQRVQQEELGALTFGGWFSRMVPLVKTGRREFYTVVD